MRRLLPFALTVAMIVGLAGTARASIIFTLGNHPQLDENNILFSAPQTGTTITGEVDHSGVSVVFTTLTGQTLTQTAQGQADINGQNGESGADINLTSMDVTVPGYTFQDFILNLQNGTGTAHVVVIDGLGGVFNYDLGNGQNYLTITTDNGSTMSEIQVTMPGGGSWDDFKQPRISGVCAVGTNDCVPPEVPEPASMLLFGTGLVGAASAARRRTHK